MTASVLIDQQSKSSRGFRTCNSGNLGIRRAFSWPAIALTLLFASHHANSAQQPSSKTSAKDAEIESLIQQRRFAEARTETLEEIQRHPSSVADYNLLGIIETDRNDYASAIAAYQRALQLAPNSVKTHVNLGSFYVAQRTFDLAEKEFRAALRIDPANREANYNLGVLLMSEGAAAEAIPHLQRVHPADTPTTLNLIHAYLQTTRTAEALRLAAELSEQNKDDVRVHFSLGVMLASEGQFKPGVLELAKADALQPETFEILYNLGQAYLRGGDNLKAELAANRAQKLKPDSPETLYLLAQVYSNESRPLDSLDLLVRAHKIAPDNTDVIFLMAQISMSQNYYEDAIPLLETGVQLAPQRPDLLALLGESYFMAGEVDKAIQEFQKLVVLDPSARSYAALGLPYRHLGRFDEAKKYFQKGLELDSRDVSCLFNLGLIASLQGDPATAEAQFQKVFHIDPNYSGALMELASIRIDAGKLNEAADLLRRYVQVNRSSPTGYYKLAMVERNLHQTVAANRDLDIFKSLSKSGSAEPLPYEHLFDYLDNRSKLAPDARNQLDVAELEAQAKKHPDQSDNQYLLAEAYLKTGKIEEAREAIAQFDKMSAGDFRTLTGVGVLLARYHLYDEAIEHFQQAQQANPSSDEVTFDLANAYFKKGLYSQALDTATKVSEAGRKDDAYLALLGDIYVHLGDGVHAEEIFRDAISRNPDNDQAYLALALLEFRENNIQAAKDALLKGQSRIPGSGKILWGLGVSSMLDGNTKAATDDFERAVELLPEWPGSYSTLGAFYYETGQVDKAKEVLSRFKSSSAAGSLDVNRIQQVLEQAPPSSTAANESMTMASRAQLLQLALALADRTL